MDHFPAVSAAHFFLDRPQIRSFVLRIREELLQVDLDPEVSGLLADEMTAVIETVDRAYEVAIDDYNDYEAARTRFLAGELSCYAAILADGWADTDPLHGYSEANARHFRAVLLAAAVHAMAFSDEDLDAITPDVLADEMEFLVSVADRDEDALAGTPFAVNDETKQTMTVLAEQVLSHTGRLNGGPSFADRSSAAEAETAAAAEAAVADLAARREQNLQTAIAQRAIWENARPGRRKIVTPAKPPKPAKAGLLARFNDWFSGGTPSGYVDIDDDDDLGGESGAYRAGESDDDRYRRQVEERRDRKRDQHRSDLEDDLSKARRARKDQEHEVSSNYGFRFGAPGQAEANAHLSNLEDEERRIEGLIEGLDRH